MAPPSRQPLRQHRLGPGARAAAALVGVAGAGAGGVAVFTTSSEAGPVALLAVAAIFGVMALTGDRLSRIKVGDNEAVFRDALAEVTSERILADPAQAQELVATVEEASSRALEPPPPELATAVDAWNYERSVYAAFQRLADGGSTVAQGPLRDAGIDLLIDGGIAILIKYRTAGRNLGARGLLSQRGMWAEVQRARAVPGVACAMLVTNQTFEADAQEPTLARSRQGDSPTLVRLVQWRDTRDDERLDTALRDLQTAARARPRS